jgi:hypothetical protein
LRAIDGMLRELARAGTGSDVAFVARVMTAVRESGAATVREPIPTREHGIVQALAALVRAWRANVRPAVAVGLGLACVALVLVEVGIHCLTPGGPNMCRGVEREMHYQFVGGQKLGQYLAEKCPGARALLIVPPTDTGDRGRRRNSLADGLREGFGRAITVVAEAGPERPAAIGKGSGVGPSAGESGIPADTAVPLEYWFTAEVFDRLVRNYAGQVDRVVTTIGLPRDPAKMKLWNMPACSSIDGAECGVGFRHASPGNRCRRRQRCEQAGPNTGFAD